MKSVLLTSRSEMGRVSGSHRSTHGNHKGPPKWRGIEKENQGVGERSEGATRLALKVEGETRNAHTLETGKGEEMDFLKSLKEDHSAITP